MKWQFWQKGPVSLDLPDDVRATLESQFQPDPAFLRACVKSGFK
jgi:hypothetical protein